MTQIWHTHTRTNTWARMHTDIWPAHTFGTHTLTHILQMPAHTLGAHTHIWRTHTHTHLAKGASLYVYTEHAATFRHARETYRYVARFH